MYVYVYVYIYIYICMYTHIYKCDNLSEMCVRFLEILLVFFFFFFSFFFYLLRFPLNNFTDNTKSL